MKFRYLENVNTLWSIGIAVATIVQWVLKIPHTVIILTLAGLVLLWVVYLLLALWLRPWHRRLRPGIYRFFGAYPFRTVYNTVFKRDFYESDYVAPAYREQVDEDVEISRELLRSHITVVIEDDPVGYILHRGSLPALVVDEKMTASKLLELLLASKEAIFEKGCLFIATPSRRLDANASLLMNRTIGAALKQFQRKCMKPVRVISKIDSCLRSNYESEYMGIIDGFGPFTLDVLVPAYVEQGRVTVHGHQYIRESNTILPIHKSEYASFTGLEYHHSCLALWLLDKNRRIRSRHHIGLIPIDALRSMSTAAVAQRIAQRPAKVRSMVFDCSELHDSQLILKSLLEAEAAGEKIFYKFGPSMINAIAQEFVRDEPLNEPSGIDPTDNAIIVAGSLSSVTKRQIACLKDEPHNSLITLTNHEIQHGDQLQLVKRKRAKVFEFIGRGDNVILTTEYWRAETNEYPSIQDRDKVLRLLAAICKLDHEEIEASWIVMKGSDTALYTLAHGFGQRDFRYCGHIIPGVIHIKVELPDGSLKSCFIIGGNVGNDSLLTDVVSLLEKEQ